MKTIFFLLLFISVNANAFLSSPESGGVSDWGDIAGTLSNQTDLQSALDLKAPQSSLDSHTSNISNPHSVTKSQVGLPLAENTSDLSKPISTATQTALDAKLSLSALSARIVFVDSVNGSDSAVSGRGSKDFPYATIQAAFNSISLATTLNQWANERISFHLQGGEYAEAAISVWFKRRSINFIGDGAKIVNDFTLNYDPTNQYTTFTYTQAGLPAPWTSGFASPTLGLGCAHNVNGMESGFTTGCMLFLGRVVFTFPNYVTQATPNYGASYVVMNGIEARAGFQANDAGSSSNSSLVLEAMTSVINGNNMGLTRAGGVSSAFTIKASNSRLTSVIGPRAIIGKLDSCRVGKLDYTTDTSGTTGIYAEGAIQFTNTTSTSGITNSTFVGSGTQNIGNYSGTTNSVIKIDLASFYQLRALTLASAGGVTYNIMDAPKVVRVVATEAGSTTMTNITDHLLIDPAANRAAYTITMKPNPTDGDEVKISGGAFGITTLTLTPNTSQTFATGSSVSTLPASSYVSFRWNAATSKWFRIGSDLINVTAASSVTNAAAGNISSINVQSAINELDSEKQASLGFSFLTNSAALDFGSILAAANEDLTLTVTGALVGDVVACARPSDQDSSLIIECFVSASNTVTFRAHNAGTIAVDQASKTYKATVFR